jgi:SWI/SNF-related matrix-associated actin-dependent regulator of chromatin subfamily A3
MIQIPVTLSKEARALYDEVKHVSEQRLEADMSANGGTINTVVRSSILGMLTRMRQLALHPGLVPANYLEQLRAAAASAVAIATAGPRGDAAPPVQLTAADRARLQSLLAQAIEDNEECAICFDVLSEPRSTPCAHFYCLAWYV